MMETSSRLNGWERRNQALILQEKIAKASCKVNDNSDFQAAFSKAGGAEAGFHLESLKQTGYTYRRLC
jgi:hypothetical protein